MIGNPVSHQSVQSFETDSNERRCGTYGDDRGGIHSIFQLAAAAQWDTVILPSDRTPASSVIS